MVAGPCRITGRIAALVVLTTESIHLESTVRFCAPHASGLPIAHPVPTYLNIVNPKTAIEATRSVLHFSTRIWFREGKRGQCL